MHSSAWDCDEYFATEEFPARPDSKDAGPRPDTGKSRPDTALSSMPSRPPSQPQFQNMQKDSEFERATMSGFFKSSRDQSLPSLSMTGGFNRGACPYEKAKWRLRTTGISSVHRLPFGVVKLPPAVERRKTEKFGPKRRWNKTHNAVVNNEGRPQGVRDYFSLDENEDDLRYTLSQSKRPGAANLMKALSQPELRKGDKGHPLTSSVLHGDADVGISPNRHREDGTMYDRDGKRHGWNNRFNSGVVNYGHLMHGTHREYFGKPSSFGRATSQLWRRQNDYKDKLGVWKPQDTLRKSRLGPMGSLEPLDPYATMC